MANNFALSDAEDNTSGPLNRGDTADLPLFRTILAICHKSVLKAKFLRSDRLFRFIDICTFCRLKNPFAMIISLSELYFRCRRFIMLLQRIKVISMSYGSSTCCSKPWRLVNLDLIYTMRDINSNYNLILLSKFTSSRRSTEFKDILTWNISQIITKTIPISTRIDVSYMMKRSLLS